MARILTTNKLKDIQALKDEKVAVRIEEARHSTKRLMAKRAQELNKVLRECQRVVALDRKKHIKISVKAYKDRVEQSLFIEKNTVTPTNVVRVDTELRDRADKFYEKKRNELENIDERMKAYFLCYEMETGNARSRKEMSMESKTEGVRQRLARTSEISLRAQQGSSTCTDIVADQLIKKMLEKEQSIKLAKLTQHKQTEENQKRMVETFMDKRTKIRAAFKGKMKHLEDLMAADQNKASKVEKHTEELTAQRLESLKKYNMKWQECFLKALEINESNVS